MDIRIYRELLRLRADIDDSPASGERDANVPLATALANFCCCVQGHYDEVIADTLLLHGCLRGGAATPQQ